MNLLQFLSAQYSTLRADQMNLHFAKIDGNNVNPVDEFMRGDFNHWQRHQPLTKEGGDGKPPRTRFTRRVVVGLLPQGGDRWLYAGAWRNDSEPVVDDGWRVFDLQPIEELGMYIGRLVVRFDLTSRATYRLAETCIDEIQVYEIHAQPLNLLRFPGHKSVDLSKVDLELLVKQDDPEWRNALSVVAGLYLITDTSTGQLYVGSACGAGGIWQRWSMYAASGHGGNKRPKELLEVQGYEHATHFRFSILEIADPLASPDEIRGRESHWKRVLGSRAHGLNSN